MEWYHYILAVAGGTVAGFLNTLAGSGTFITLPFLIWLGLPATVANGTNRIGILFQSAVAVSALKRQSGFGLKGSMHIVLVVVAGGITGAFIAVDINEELMRKIIGTMMLLLVILMATDKNKLLSKETDITKRRPSWLAIAAYFVIGIYIGFIQLGAGLFLLGAINILHKVDMVFSNWLKNVIVLILTIPVLCIFIAHGQVDLKLGLLLAVGQMGGAWIASMVASKINNADKWIRWFVVIVALLSGLELLGVRKVFL